MTSERSSFGGQVVASSLNRVGFDVSAPGVALVETAPPTHRYSHVLVQSAWNVVSRDEFTFLIKDYPPQMRLRATLRRLVAQLNIRRAERVVCLTHSVAEMVASTTGVHPIVAPATLPADAFQLGSTPVVEKADPYALVPGTVSWFKRPLDAVKWVRHSGEPRPWRLVFCGRDDGSGCWPAVVAAATELGVQVERRVVSRPELFELYRRASVTLLPSALESLGFALGEALLYSPRVVARPIAAHIEVAQRLGRSPSWGFEDVLGGSVPHRGHLTESEVRAEWVAVGRALGLTLRVEQPTSPE